MIRLTKGTVTAWWKYGLICSHTSLMSIKWSGTAGRATETPKEESQVSRWSRMESGKTWHSWANNKRQAVVQTTEQCECKADRVLKCHLNSRKKTNRRFNDEKLKPNILRLPWLLGPTNVGVVQRHACVLSCFCCCCCQVASVVSDSVWPQRRQPTRLLHPWDSPGKNAGVGCHFHLQCMKVKSESVVA